MKVWEVNYNALVYGELMNGSVYVRADDRKNAKTIAKKMIDDIKDKNICFVKEIKTIN